MPIVALASVLRGYFQGMQNMRPYAFSQVIEQVIRVSLVALLAKHLMPYGIEYASAGAMAAGVTGEAVSLVYMLITFKAKKKIKIRRNFFAYLEGGKSAFRGLMSVALPTTGSRLIGSVSYFLQPIIVAQSLAMAGLTTVAATKQYGELTGFALSLLFLPSFITHALHVSLVPTISEAAARKQFRVIHYRLNQALKIALISGGGAMIICYVFAEPMLKLMYHSPQSASYVYFMAPFFLFLYFQSPFQAVLQALDLARAAMINTAFGEIIKLGTIFAFASQPQFGIMGAALGYCVSIVLVTFLHMASVIKTIGFSLNVLDFLKGGGVLCFSFFIARWFKGWHFHQGGEALQPDDCDHSVCFCLFYSSYCVSSHKPRRVKASSYYWRIFEINF